MTDYGVPTVAVTGASGFVGSHFCGYLAARGHRVIALSRGPTPADVHPLIDTRAWTGMEDGVVPQLLKGADAVVHLAGRAHVMREPDDDARQRFERANVDGTERVLDAAAIAGVRRFVFVSTIKVLGEGGPVPLREEDALDPRDYYGESKARAEQLVRASVGLDWAIVRPPLVYGPGVRANFARLLALASLGRRLPLPLGGITNRRSFVSLTNLSSALALTVTAPGTMRDTFHVSDGDDLGTSELLARLIVAMGGKPRLFHVPVPGPLRAGALGRLFESLAVDSSRIRQRLGWTAPQPVASALQETANWYLERHG